eukprot:UN26443
MKKCPQNSRQMDTLGQFTPMRTLFSRIKHVRIGMKDCIYPARYKTVLFVDFIFYIFVPSFI